MRLRKIAGATAATAWVRWPQWPHWPHLMFAGGAQAANQAPTARTGVDTTPPDPFVRARARQDLDDVLAHGIQTTCGTEDDERPVTCSMTAKRKGRVLAGDSAVIHSPYNRYQFHLRLSAADRDKLRRADPPIVIKLVLRVRDEAGNVGTDQKRIKLVDGLW